MPHLQDQSQDPGYLNKLLLVRPDLSVRLCQSKETRTRRWSVCISCLLFLSNSHRLSHRCYTSSHKQRSSYLRLSPHKIEILNESPLVYLIHDFTSDSGTKIVRDVQTVSLIHMQVWWSKLSLWFIFLESVSGGINQPLGAFQIKFYWQFCLFRGK